MDVSAFVAANTALLNSGILTKRIHDLNKERIVAGYVGGSSGSKILPYLEGFPVHPVVVNGQFTISRFDQTASETVDQICAAAWSGDVGEMKNLLTMPIAHYAVNVKNGRGQTALYCAARQGYELIVLLLLNLSNINVNLVTTGGGSTPLHAASYGGHASVAALLLASGARSDIKNDHGYTAMQEAQIFVADDYKLFREKGKLGLADKHPILYDLHSIKTIDPIDTTAHHEPPPPKKSDGWAPDDGAGLPVQNKSHPFMPHQETKHKKPIDQPPPPAATKPKTKSVPTTPPPDEELATVAAPDWEDQPVPLDDFFMNHTLTSDVVSLVKYRLKEIPTIVFDAKHIKVLILSYNKLTSVDPRIGQLKGLTSLDLSCNSLTTLAPEIWGLKHLEFFSAGCNFLTSLSGDISNLKNLKELQIYENQLTTLPKELASLKQLSIINFSRNNVEEMYPGIWTLRWTHVNAGYNRLKFIVVPADISSLENLTFLDVSENPELTTIPVSFFQLKNLHQVYLGDLAEQFAHVNGKSLSTAGQLVASARARPDSPSSLQRKNTVSGGDMTSPYLEHSKSRKGRFSVLGLLPVGKGHKDPGKPEDYWGPEAAAGSGPISPSLSVSPRSVTPPEPSSPKGHRTGTEEDERPSHDLSSRPHKKKSQSTSPKHSTDNLKKSSGNDASDMLVKKSSRRATAPPNMGSSAERLRGEKKPSSRDKSPSPTIPETDQKEEKVKKSSRTSPGLESATALDKQAKRSSRRSEVDSPAAEAGNPPAKKPSSRRSRVLSSPEKPVKSSTAFDKAKSASSPSLNDKATKKTSDPALSAKPSRSTSNPAMDKHSKKSSETPQSSKTPK